MGFLALSTIAQAPQRLMEVAGGFLCAQ